MSVPPSSLTNDKEAMNMSAYNYQNDRRRVLYYKKIVTPETSQRRKCATRVSSRCTLRYKTPVGVCCRMVFLYHYRNCGPYNLYVYDYYVRLRITGWCACASYYYYYYHYSIPSEFWSVILPSGSSLWVAPGRLYCTATRGGSWWCVF